MWLKGCILLMDALSVKPKSPTTKFIVLKKRVRCTMDVAGSGWLSASTSNSGTSVISLYIVPSLNDIDDELLSQYRTVLDDSEKYRLSRFRFKKDRKRYLVTRALIRYILTETIGGPPTKWRFSTNKYGKPYLLAEDGMGSLHFNLSHTDSMVACAVSETQELGLDVEKNPDSADILNAASDFFAEVEVQNLFSQPANRRLHRFLEFWTLKEAFIKAVGMGLSMPLDKFWFALDGRSEIKVAIDKQYAFLEGDWSFFLFRPAADHLGALAIKEKTNFHEFIISKVVPFKELQPVYMAINSRPQF